MVFELSESLLTGIRTLDDDHRQLIVRINLIAEIEHSPDRTALLAALSELKADLASHFQSEETHLQAVGYPKLGSHAKHHAESIIALDYLMRDIQDGEPIEGDAAHICYHEIVSVILLRDMQFINWLADHPELTKE